MAILYFLADELIQNHQQQDCWLIVEVHTPDRIDDQLVQLAAEEAIEDKFGKHLTLRPADQKKTSHYLQAYPGATNGWLKLGAGVPLFWHLSRMV